MKKIAYSFSSLPSLALASSIALGAAWLAPSVAFAQGAPTVTGVSEAVYLKDGSVIRGRITELKEGSHVLVQLESGQVARVRWDFVARLERAAGASAPAAPATTAPAVTTVAAPAAATQAMVTVHIDSPEAVRLERMEGRTGVFVCESPCDMPVPLAGTYRIGGSIKSTRQFNLSGQPGDRITITVDPASKGGFVGGIILLSVGGAALVIGAFVYLAGATADAIDGYGNTSDGSGLKAGGGITMALGAAGLATGIVLVALNGSSKLEQSRGGAPPPQGKVRRPDWMPPRDPITASIAPPVVFPLGFRF